MKKQWILLTLIVLLPILGACNPVTAPVDTAPVDSETATAAAENPLADTSWQMTDYADPNVTTGMSTVLLAATPTAIFGADGTISGSGGCNSYSGTYQVDGDALTIPGPLTTTMMMCDEAVMAQETVFLTNLQAVAGFTLFDEEPQLHLLNDKSQVIILLKQQ